MHMAARTIGSTDPAVPVADRRRGILPAHYATASTLDFPSDDHFHVGISEPRY